MRTFNQYLSESRLARVSRLNEARPAQVFTDAELPVIRLWNGYTISTSARDGHEVAVFRDGKDEPVELAYGSKGFGEMLFKFWKC